MSTRKMLKSIALLLSPLLLFVLLAYPYNRLNSEVLVDIFGCGCPQINEQGEIVHPTFTANSITVIFWFAMALCATVAEGIICCRIIPKNKAWLRVLCIAGMLAVSLLIANYLRHIMMWC